MRSVICFSSLRERIASASFGSTSKETERSHAISSGDSTSGSPRLVRFVGLRVELFLELLFDLAAGLLRDCFISDSPRRIGRFVGGDHASKLPSLVVFEDDQDKPLLGCEPQGDESTPS